MKIKYFSDDGKEHSSEEACRKHEAANTIEARVTMPLTGGGQKSLAMLQAAMRYDAETPGARDLADALEQVARKCAQARIDQGGAKRKRKDKTSAPPPVGETKSETVGHGPSEGQCFPTEANPFPEHGPAGKVSAAGAGSPIAAE